MPDSALFGSPPLNANDEDIIKGLFGTSKPPKPVSLPPGAPVSQAKGLLIGLCFAIIFVIFITGARLMTRALRKAQVFGWDDWVIIPGALLAVAFFANIIARINYGCAGKHINYCTYKELAFWAQAGGINQITFFASVTLIKISMCLFNHRLTGISSKPWQIINNIFLALLVIWFFLSFFINLFQCQPVTAFFNFSIKVHTSTYHCLDTGKINNSFSIINCVSDFCLLSVPIWIILRVQMPPARKARLVGIFCLGCACCICSAYRSTLGNRNSKDLTWIFVPEVSWTIADVFFSAVVASLPALNAVAEAAWLKSISSFRTSSKGILSGSGNTSSKRSWFPMSGSATEDRSGTDSRNRGEGLSTQGYGFGGGRGSGDMADKEMGKGGTVRYSIELYDVESAEHSPKRGL